MCFMPSGGQITVFAKIFSSGVFVRGFRDAKLLEFRLSFKHLPSGWVDVLDEHFYHNVVYSALRALLGNH
jgi:hypothetical protein